MCYAIYSEGMRVKDEKKHSGRDKSKEMIGVAY
jgi:hypothetical protein